MGTTETLGIVLTTVATEDDAARIATALVERRLAACVNIIPGIRSVYRWKNEIQDDRELILVAKARRDAFERVRTAIREHHSYETPEIVMLPVVDGDPDYLAWATAETDSPQTA